MAKTPSTMVALNTIAPDFTLPDSVSGTDISLADIAESKKGVLVMFICNHCPYVKHVQHELAQLGLDYITKGLGIVAISSNDINNYPADSPEKMDEFAAEVGLTFPYLYDETQEVARSYDAACTPDFFLYRTSPSNRQLELVYRGQLDDSRPGSDIPVTGRDLRNAIECLLNGKEIPQNQTPSLGCNIKWKQ